MTDQQTPTIDYEALDWRTIKTDTPEGCRQLDIYIAQHAGWHLRTKPYPYSEEEKESGNYTDLQHDLMSPEDKLITSCWRDPLGRPGSMPNTPWEWFYHRLPHYSTDLNAAMALIPTEGCSFKLKNQQSTDHANDWECRLEDASGIVQASNRTPALAICDAWCIQEGSTRWDAETAGQS